MTTRSPRGTVSTSNVLVLLAATGAVLTLVSGCNGQHDGPDTKASAAQDVQRTGSSLSIAISQFHDDTQAFPRQVALSTGRVRLIGSGATTATTDAELRGGVKLEWYVRKPTKPGFHAKEGFAFCISKAGRYKHVVDNDEQGTIATGPTKGSCPAELKRF